MTGSLATRTLRGCSIFWREVRRSGSFTSQVRAPGGVRRLAGVTESPAHRFWASESRADDLLVRAGLYRGSRGFWKRPYGRPEGPNRYGTLWCGSGEDKEQGREPCRDLWCGSGEDKSRERRGGGWRCRDGDGIGGSEDVASETAKITSPSARRRSPA